MGLIYCSACGNRISAAAPTCPHCGHPSTRVANYGGQPFSRPWYSISSTFIVVLIIIGAIIGFMSMNAQKNSGPHGNNDSGAVQNRGGNEVPPVEHSMDRHPPGADADEKLVTDAWRIRQENNPEYKKGEKLMKAGDFQTAIVCFTKAIESDPKHYSAYGARGFCYTKPENMEKELKNAVSDLTVAIANSSESVWGAKQMYNHRGLCYIYMGGNANLEKAVSDFTEAIRIDARYAKAYYNRYVARSQLAGPSGNQASAEADLAEARRLDPTIK
jgi:tetratricopeptide (TPR) repeat protein